MQAEMQSLSPYTRVVIIIQTILAGNEFYAAGEYAKAVNAYNKAVKIEPNNGVLYRSRTENCFQCS